MIISEVDNPRLFNMGKQKMVVNSILAGLLCSILTSLIIFALPGFIIPPFTGNAVIDTIIFVVGELLLWFILWYLVLSMRGKFRRGLDPGSEQD